MHSHWRHGTWIFAVVLSGGIFTSGCHSESKAQLREKNAFLAGQNSVLLQQQAQAAQQTAAQSPSIQVLGAVQHPQVPWVSGLTLAQAIATANYVGQAEPKQIIITQSNGETATLDASAILNGTDIPLQIGDVIELR